MSFKIKGFDEFQNKLNQISKNVNELEGNNQIPLYDLFTESFMLKYTKFPSFDTLLEAGNFVVNSPEDFEAIPDEDFDKHVADTTKFDTWEDMLAKAGEIYIVKKLGF